MLSETTTIQFRSSGLNKKFLRPEQLVQDKISFLNYPPLRQILQTEVTDEYLPSIICNPQDIEYQCNTFTGGKMTDSKEKLSLATSHLLFYGF